MKQPKHFYSSKKPLKVSPIFASPQKESEGSVVPEVQTPAQPATPFRLPTVNLPSVTLPTISLPSFHVPGAVIFCAGALSLVGMTTLVLLSAKIITVPTHLQVILPQHSSDAIVAQTSSGTVQGVNFDVQTADARVDIVANFLTRYDSPLTPASHYAQELVMAADRYNLDYRLLPAIMMQESNLCKTSDPALHNCLGFGIHKRGTLGFDSYEEGFDRAARELKERYIDIGLTTPEQIMTKYTPSSNGSWANSVNQWIAEMEHNDRSKGITQKTNADLTVYTGE